MPASRAEIVPDLPIQQNEFVIDGEQCTRPDMANPLHNLPEQHGIVCGE